ncbi:MAG TPA: hypothetical protein VK419_05450 [Bryobacteraceae bacterium]|nr:hypothetical protein [Bryobacteraceae bacterium]
MEQRHAERDPIVDFGEFVKREQTASAQTRSEDWIKERDDFLAYLSELYAQIRSFLDEYVRSGGIKIDCRDFPLNEENIGSYTAPQMIIRIGGKEITLTPAGTLLIGAKGRVDIAGPAGRSRLVLVDRDASGPAIKVTVRRGQAEAPAANALPRNIKWSWKIATSPPGIQYIELTKEEFSRMLLEVVNG